MLTSVPIEINRAARQITLYHPNAVDCTVMRKQVTRGSQDEPNMVGGMPTLGAMGVLDQEDETEWELVELGEAKVVMVGQYQGGDNNVQDNDIGVNYPLPPTEALIECLADPDNTDEFFVCDRRDILIMAISDDIVMAYEIVDITAPVGIPPYNRKYILNPREDLSMGI